MKPRNFPARISKRRLDALQRLRKSGRTGADAEHEFAALNERIDPNARAIRTKKDRRNRAKVRAA